MSTEAEPEPVRSQHADRAVTTTDPEASPPDPARRGLRALGARIGDAVRAAHAASVPF